MRSHPIYNFDPTAFISRYGGSTSKYRHGDIIYAEGDPADCLFYIVSGRVSINIHHIDGKEIIVAVLHAGEFFGEACVSPRRVRTSTIVSIEDCTIARFSAATVLQTLHDDRPFCETFITFLLERTEQLKMTFVERSVTTSEQRLARVLILLGIVGYDADVQFVPVHVNQQILANMVGTTRARINHFMNKFRNLDYIDYNGQITIHPSLLTAFSDTRSRRAS